MFTWSALAQALPRAISCFPSFERFDLGLDLCLIVPGIKDAENRGLRKDLSSLKARNGERTKELFAHIA